MRVVKRTLSGLLIAACQQICAGAHRFMCGNILNANLSGHTSTYTCKGGDWHHGRECIDCLPGLPHPECPAETEHSAAAV